MEAIAAAAVGLGWSTWGNGAHISSDQLETFGESDVAGGIARTLDVTFPLKFAFDFSTNTPSDGGWQIAFNAKTADGGLLSNFTGEIGLFQFTGAGAICSKFQTSSGPMAHCGNTVSGQRDFTANAHISATLNADFSATVTIKYNDGMLPSSVTLKVAAPAGAIQTYLVGLANRKMLVLEVKGQDNQEQQTKREFLGEWVRAINSHSGFGMWVADVSRNPTDIHEILQRHAT